MDKQIVEISNDGFSLFLHRGFLVVSNQETSLNTEIPLDNILSLVISAHNITLSKNIINAIIEQGANIILCGKKYIPCSIIMPYAGHWLIAPRIQRQIQCSKPLQKNLWKSIVQHKIYNQAQVLELFFPDHSSIARLKQLAKETLSNDARNNEGRAASLYFKSLFGKNFVRDRLSDDINILLNYAYIVLRAMIIRAICGNGLLPFCGLKHCSKTNIYPLADDLIEPFRPWADRLVFEEIKRLDSVNNIELTPEIKRRLTRIITMPVKNEKGCVSLNDAVFDFVSSLVSCFEGKKVKLKYPLMMISSSN